MTAEWRERLDSLRLKSLREMFGVEKPIIGMVHLWPLPGAPGYTGYGMEAIVEHALRDAEALVEVIVPNLGRKERRQGEPEGEEVIQAAINSERS